MLLALITLFWSIFTYYYPSPNKNQFISALVSSKTMSSVSEKKPLHGSIFELSEKIYSTKTTIEKQEFIKKYVGLYVQDSGYIIDVEKDKYMDNKYTIAMIINSEENKKRASIQCFFINDWEQAILGSSFSGKIKFSWTIIGGKNYRYIFAYKEDVPLIYLWDCNILQ